LATVGRLKRRSDFLRLAAGRRKAVAPGLILQAAAGGERVRVGFTVSRKVGNAVKRNRARRRLRAAAALLAEHAAPGHDYVLIGRAATLSRPFPALLEDLASALRRLGLYRPGSGGEEGESVRR
jgi:ribonuclease P protein component